MAQLSQEIFKVSVSRLYRNNETVNLLITDELIEQLELVMKEMIAGDVLIEIEKE